VGWLIIYRTSPNPRALAVIGLIAGAVFFPGYIHLFHIYGHSYSVVLIMLALMLRGLFAPEWFKRWEMVLAAAAALLTFWHPFGPIVFLGFYFGRYVDQFATIEPSEHIRRWVILGGVTIALVLPIVLSPNLGVSWSYNPWFAFLVSYQTNELHPIASAIAWLLAFAAVVTYPVSARWKVLLSIVLAGLGVLLYRRGIPVLLLWMAVALGKTLLRRAFGLAVAFVMAIMLPYAGRIGGPVYGLFPIALAVFITTLDWRAAEERLRRVTPRHVTLAVAALIAAATAIRAGVPLPVASRIARPLLAERERTFQLEHVLAWLGSSPYCAHDLAFAEASGSPIDSVESVVDRRYRPPSAIEDVLPFWNTALRCPVNEHAGRHAGVALVTFGGQPARATKVFEVPGAYAGPTTVWIRP
jgi:hypothetical protein